MIYLIGGAPRCGKTILATKLSKKYNLPFLSTDTLRSLIISFLPRKKINKLMPFQINGSERMTPQQSLRAELREAKTMWCGLEALIKKLADMKQNYIIDGTPLCPKYVVTLQKSKYLNSIKSIFLIKENYQKILNYLNKNIPPSDWLSPHLKNKKLMQNIAKMVMTKSAHIKKEANKYNFLIKNTDTYFNKTINEL